MNISYTTGKLEKILTNERLIKREYTQIYKNVMNRLSELRTANNLEEIPHIPPPRRHKLNGDYDDCWGVDVSKNFRIILKPTGDWNELDLKTITSIEILTISDYH
ncbi:MULTISPECIES: type II toxin-antitoxin system RelE/ParE family toxin [unclassified Lysinibacillus]|uniref:type II toxin-antitoxin system RelE/ParE family toxin n=1 Tax=unclassified Lysinibacillus TaxID=2636778 RepID=UPI00232D0722|nr:plasmid maintenance system killer protein [Lysinibacillus sp. OF-1]WCH45844.1 plasmid maintenance system killer protein [Lysinibacillus sp. OF-1]